MLGTAHLLQGIGVFDRASQRSLEARAIFARWASYSQIAWSRTVGGGSLGGSNIEKLLSMLQAPQAR